MNTLRNLSIAGKKMSFWGGLNLVILAVIIFIFPAIVAYAIALMLLVVGLGLMMFSRRLKTSGNRTSQQSQTTFIYTD